MAKSGPSSHPGASAGAGKSKLLPIILVIIGVVVLLGAAGYFLVLKPAGGRAQVIADRTASAANMTGINAALFAYSIENRDLYPEHLAQLGRRLRPELLTNPGRTDPATVPAMPDVADADALKAWIDAHCDYVYVWKEGLGAGVEADQIILYEKHNPTDEGVNVTFGDGDTQWFPMAEAKAVIAAGKR